MQWWACQWQHVIPLGIVPDNEKRGGYKNVSTFVGVFVKIALAM